MVSVFFGEGGQPVHSFPMITRNCIAYHLFSFVTTGSAATTTKYAYYCWTVDYLRHCVNFPCWRKHEYPKKAHKLRNRECVDFFTSDQRLSRIEKVLAHWESISEVKSEWFNHFATKTPSCTNNFLFLYHSWDYPLFLCRIVYFTSGNINPFFNL